jgi:uncharacterized protein
MPGFPEQTVKPLRFFAPTLGPLLLTILISAGPAAAQSFDCKKAFYADEKTICQDSRLGQLDQELASVYGRWAGRLPKARREEIEGNETLFVQARRRCGQNRDCIEHSYRNRIEEIQGASAEEDRGGSGRTRASDPPRRSSGVSVASPPERDPRSGEAASGAAASPAQASEGEVELRAKRSGPNNPSPEAASVTRVPPVTNAPTRSEATEALRSTDREEPTESDVPKRHRRTRVQSISGSPPEGEASHGAKTEHGKREAPSRETNAVPAPERRHPPSRTSATTASASTSKEQPTAPQPPAPTTGSTGWVNPPPER